MNPRPTQVQVARAMKTKIPQLNLELVGKFPFSFNFFIQPKNKASRDSLMSSINLQQVLPNAIVNARNVLPKAKSKTSFVIVNVHHSIQEDEMKEEQLRNNGMNVTKVSKITSRTSGKPTKLIRVKTDSTNLVLAAQKNGAKMIG